MATAKAEVIDAPQELALRPERPEAQFTLFGTQDPALVVQKATETSKALISVVEAQSLYTVISGKKYPRVEAWTLLGSMLGVFPVLKWTRPLEDHAGWEARVEAHTMSGVVVGAAESMCDRSETRWKDADEHAVRSMAQTRATSKALGMPLRFVMVLSGFEGTPAEEMPSEPGGAWKPVAATRSGWRHERDGREPQGPPCPTENCNGHLVQRATKTGKNPGSPFLVCDSGPNGCGMKPIWDTSLEDYVKGEADFGNVVDADPVAGPTYSTADNPDLSDIDYIVARSAEVPQDKLMEAFTTGALVACLSKNGSGWFVERTKIEHAPKDRLKLIANCLRLAE